MMELIKKTERIKAIDLLYAGYDKVNDWKYVYNIKKGVRWHAKVIGRFIEIHQDRTFLGRHRVCLANIGKEIGRIKVISRKLKNN